MSYKTDHERAEINHKKFLECFDICNTKVIEASRKIMCAKSLTEARDIVSDLRNEMLSSAREASAKIDAEVEV